MLPQVKNDRGVSLENCDHLVFASRNANSVQARIKAAVRPEFLIFGIWLVLVIWLNTLHEVWRDEARALWFAIDTPSLADLLLGRGDKDNHPILWNVALRLAYGVAPSYVVLKIANIAFVGAAVALVLFKSPFPWWVRYLFPFGIFPLYEYGTIARNYGLAMLLLFVAAAFQEQRKVHPIVYGIILSALANATHHTLLFACLLALPWVVDIIRNHRSGTLNNPLAATAGVLTFVASVVYCLWLTWPESTGPVHQNSFLDPTAIAQSLQNNLLNLHRPLNTLFPGWMPSWVDNVVIGILLLGLWQRPMLLFLGFAGLVLFGLFSDLVHSTPLRHDGLYAMFLFSLYWIRLSNDPQAQGGTLSFLMGVVAPAVLIAAIVGGITPIARDIRGNFSASKDLGRFLSSDALRQTAILLPEPPQWAEAVPYYTPNRVFNVRDNRFNRAARFDRRTTLSLGKLVEQGKLMAQRETVPVYIVLARRFSDHLDRPGNSSAGLVGKFSWSAEDVSNLRSSTRLIASFSGSPTESYSVYEVKPAIP